jgi:ubiquinone/menaquinone biosynthesis C-methylase UbiE
MHMANRSFKNQLVLRLLAVVFFLTLPGSSPASEDRRGSFRCFLNFKFVSINARVGARSYRQIAARNLSELDDQLRPGFTQDMLAAPAGREVLDVGGGFSIYGIELSKAGHNVTTINAQDFYGEAVYPLADRNKTIKFIQALPAGEEGRYILSNNPISSQLIRHLSSTFSIPMPPSLKTGEKDLLYFPNQIPTELCVKELTDFFSRVQAKVEEAEASKHFRRYTALAQDVLPNIPDQSKDVIIDSYGAYYYSADRLVHNDTRVGLLSHYYRVLKVGGRAEIAISALFDRITLPNGKEMDFYDFLAMGNPQMFRVVTSDGSRTLVMTRSEDPDAIERILRLLGEPKISADKGANGLIYPNYDFTLHPPTP